MTVKPGSAKSPVGRSDMLFFLVLKTTFSR